MTIAITKFLVSEKKSLQSKSPTSFTFFLLSFIYFSVVNTMISIEIVSIETIRIIFIRIYFFIRIFVSPTLIRIAI